MGNSRQIKAWSVRQLSVILQVFFFTMIVFQERGTMYEDASLFNTCISQYCDDDAELSDS